MVQTQDIFLRALAVAPDKKKRKGTYRPSTPAADDSKWSKVALVFDTESRITADQSLTFGVYRLCELVKVASHNAPEKIAARVMCIIHGHQIFGGSARHEDDDVGV